MFIRFYAIAAEGFCRSATWGASGLGRFGLGALGPGSGLPAPSAMRGVEPCQSCVRMMTVHVMSLHVSRFSRCLSVISNKASARYFGLSFRGPRSFGFRAPGFLLSLSRDYGIYSGSYCVLLFLVCVTTFPSQVSVESMARRSHEFRLQLFVSRSDSLSRVTCPFRLSRFSEIV
jgi:hypothetical protein